MSAPSASATSIAPAFTRPDPRIRLSRCSLNRAIWYHAQFEATELFSFTAEQPNFSSAPPCKAAAFGLPGSSTPSSHGFPDAGTDLPQRFHRRRLQIRCLELHGVRGIRSHGRAFFAEANLYAANLSFRQPTMRPRHDLQDKLARARTCDGTTLPSGKKGPYMKYSGTERPCPDVKPLAADVFAFAFAAPTR